MDLIVSNGTGESVKVHPLVILNISDHFTRVRAQNSMLSGASAKSAPVQVYGALYGKQEGRKIEISTSFELALIEGGAQIDMEYFQSKAEKFKEVFGDVECLGWYTTGGSPDESDSIIHRQFMEINENPVMLKLSPLQSSTSELPLGIWEGCVASDGEQISFVSLGYVLATDEAERIGVDHVARVSTVHHSRKTTLASSAFSASNAPNHDFSSQGGNITIMEPQSTISEQYMSHHSAVKMLHSRVRLILDYVCALETGQLAATTASSTPPSVRDSQHILRDINALIHSLPLVPPPSATPSSLSSLSPSNAFDQEFLQQYNEVALLSFLGTLMKGCNSINQYAQKFSKVHDQPLGTQQSLMGQGPRGRPRGGFS